MEGGLGERFWTALHLKPFPNASSALRAPKLRIASTRITLSLGLAVDSANQTPRW